MTEKARPTVPRDEAFWNTYNDVNGEIHTTAKRSQCLHDGHEMVWFTHKNPECRRCGCDWRQYLADMESAGHTVTRDGNTNTITFGSSYEPPAS